MGKSSSGPDWTDIANWMRENERLTGYEYVLLVTCDISAGGLPINCTVLACEKGSAPWAEGGGFALTCTWPNQESRTFEGALFKALVSIDAMIYKQRDLFANKTA